MSAVFRAGERGIGEQRRRGAVRVVFWVRNKHHTQSFFLNNIRYFTKDYNILISVKFCQILDSRRSAIADDAVLPPEDDAPLAAAELLARAAELLVTAEPSRAHPVDNGVSGHPVARSPAGKNAQIGCQFRRVQRRSARCNNSSSHIASVAAADLFSALLPASFS